MRFVLLLPVDAAALGVCDAFDVVLPPRKLSNVREGAID